MLNFPDLGDDLTFSGLNIDNEDFALSNIVPAVLGDIPLDICCAERDADSKPMVDWTHADVMQFIKTQLNSRNVENSEEIAKRFQNFSGHLFKDLPNEYCNRVANNLLFGTIIFDAKEALRREQTRLLPEGDALVKDDSPNTHDNHPQETRRGRCGRPRTNSTRSKDGKPSEKIWQFIINLLKDPKTCPTLIKWEDFEEGTFKFVQSERVARLWGSRNNNEGMTYDKFSRAMRYYYKREILLPVPNKRLVYKFGSNATGWNTASPLTDSSQ